MNKEKIKSVNNQEIHWWLVEDERVCRYVGVHREVSRIIVVTLGSSMIAAEKKKYFDFGSCMNDLHGHGSTLPRVVSRSSSSPRRERRRCRE